jgi:hypothetical protein
MLYVSHINADNTISVKDSETKQITHIPVEQVKNPNAMIPSILGVFRYGMSVEIHEITWDNGSDCFKPIIDTIQNDTIRMYANIIRHIIPPYIFEIPASSTGKYHPPTDLGEGGLKRHTLAVVKMFDYLTTPTYSKMMFTQDELDCMRVACLMHDGLKMGWTKGKTTIFEHPILMAKAIRGCQFILSSEYVNLIAHCVESHMGQWNVSNYAPGVVLPVPSDKYQYFVHLADYLASRPDLIFTSFGEGKTQIESEGKSTTVKATKLQLSDKDLQVLSVALQKASMIEIPVTLRKKYGIDRNPTEICDIWNTLYQYRTCSEKQSKYLNLAKEYAKGSMPKAEVDLI